LYRKIFEKAAAIASLCRILHIRFKYPGAKINFRCHIAKGCTISCTEGAEMILTDVYISRNVVLIADNCGKMHITRSFIGFDSILVAGEHIEINEHCAIAEMVVIRDQDHVFGDGGLLKESGMNHSPIRLGRNVWVGSKATILRGVSVGDNGVIGASSVVTKNIDQNVLVAGIPAKVLKQIVK